MYQFQFTHNREYTRTENTLKNEHKNIIRKQNATPHDIQELEINNSINMIYSNDSTLAWPTLKAKSIKPIKFRNTNGQM